MKVNAATVFERYGNASSISYRIFGLIENDFWCAYPCIGNGEVFCISADAITVLGEVKFYPVIVVSAQLLRHEWLNIKFVRLAPRSVCVNRDHFTVIKSNALIMSIYNKIAIYIRDVVITGVIHGYIDFHPVSNFIFGKFW